MRAECKIIPEYAREILHTLTGAGFEAYYAGGCVRDICIRTAPQDIDIACSATPEEVTALFEKTVPTGIAHGTVTVCAQGGSVEVTSFRREGTYTDGRHPDRVAFGATAREDAARRDFTVNALFMDEAGNVIDYENGMEDLQKGIIRAVGDPQKRFEEDGLRMLRAFRFCAKTGFRLDEKTGEAIRLCAPRMRLVAAERICAEIVKLLDTPRTEWMNEVCKSGLLQDFGINGELNEKLRRGLTVPGDGKQRLALLAAGLQQCGDIQSGEELLHALRCDRETVGLAGKIQRIGENLPRERVEMKLAMQKAGKKAVYAALAFSEDWKRERALFSDILSSGECWCTSMLKINGSDIGYSGAECGRILRALTEHCIRHPEDNCKEKLLKLCEAYK